LRLDAVILLLFVCLFGSSKISAQTYNYTYTDPCTGNDKTIIVPINGNVTVGYYGEVGSFSYNDFTNGTFESWASNIFSQYGTNSPCSEIVGLGTAVNVTQSTALNVIGILNSLSTIAEIAGSGSTNILGGAVSSVSNSGNSEESKEGEGNNQNNGTGANNNNQGNTANSGSNTNSSQGQGEGTANQGSGGEAQQGGGENPAQSGSNENGNQQTVTPVNNSTTTTDPKGNPESATGNNTTGNTQSGTANPNSGGTSETTQTPENGTTTQQGEQTNTQSGTTEGNQGTGGEQTNNQSTGNGESGNNNSNGNTGNTGNGGNGSGNNNSNGQEEGQTEQGQGKTNITAGASTTVKSTPTSKEGGKPTVVGSADFIGFNFKNSEVKTGAKATGGYTAMRWDGKRSYGAMADYTSALKGPNITAFYAWVKPKSIILTSGTLTIGFEGNRSLYGTFAAGQMFNMKKPKNLKLLYMGTVSYGNVYRESFLGTALIAGAMYDFKVGKRFDIKLMNLFVYAPYVSYYNDVVLKSPYVMLPSIGTNIKITKKFKFNINGGGAWDLKTSALNYTITCGTRLVIGQ